MDNQEYLSDRKFGFDQGIAGQAYSRKRFCSKRYGDDLLALIENTIEQAGRS
jgi:hypothetical protein